MKCPVCKGKGYFGELLGQSLNEIEVLFGTLIKTPGKIERCKFCNGGGNIL